MPVIRELVVVPHTHWDREWYEPREVFRVRLVHLLDRLLDMLEAEPAYRFTLDGQAVMVEDYLEMRPHNRARLAALVAQGRLAVGPFLILMDEFSCDGETIIRNLERGLAVCRGLGGAMRVGHLPDLFGHVAQMPQILAGFDIAHSVLWRGVPDRVRAHAFAWEAPNGDTVRCEYIFDSYGNALDLFAVPGQLETLAPAYVERTASWYGGGPVLGMLGGDHSTPPSDLLEVVRTYNDAVGDPRITVATLDGYLHRHDTTTRALEALPRVRGELRSHARGNILPGVFSIRTNLKADMGRAERALEAAERLDLMQGRRDHRAFLEAGWHRLVESTAHDSVTGCCVDTTADQVSARIAAAGHIARGVTQVLLGDLARNVSPGTHVVFNPSGQDRRAHVEVTVRGVDAGRVGSGVQLLDGLPTVLGDEEMASADLPRLLRRIHGRELFGQQIDEIHWSDDGLRFLVSESPRGLFDLAAFTVAIEQRVAADPENRRRWRVETTADPRHRALLAVDVDGLGLAAVSEATAASPCDPVRVSATTLANAALTASVNDDGTVRIETASGTCMDGAFRLVDEGDCGDAYNYGPVDGLSAVSAPSVVEMTVLEHGPLRGRIRIRRCYDVPRGLDPQRCRTAETVPLWVDTVIELREGEGFLRVTISFTNPATDHRLRVLVPTGGHAHETSRSAGQYGVTVRGREGEGGWGEFPLPTYPAYRFAAAGHVAVLVRKLTEYELVTDASRAADALALTLVRAVGMMSVNVHPLRDEPAGSEIPVPGAQYLGTTVFTELAIVVGAADDAALLRAADRFRHDPLVARGTGPSDGPLPEPSVRVRYDGLAVLESARRVGTDAGDEAELRFVSYVDHEGPLGLAADGEWVRTTLTGEPRGEVLDLAVCTVPAHGIVTLRCRCDTR